MFPAADATISDGSHIAIERARPLDLTINGKERQVWTTADTVDQALVQLGQDPAALDLSADRSREIPLGGLELTANALRTVSVSDAGRPAKKVSTGAKTVADVLKEQGVSLGSADTTEPALTTAVKNGQQIKVSRVTVKTVTQTVAIAPKDVRTDDPKLDKGSTVVAAKGKPGKQKVVIKVTTVNGKVTSRKEVSRTTVTQPTPNQVRVGTKSGLDVQGGRVFFHDTEFGVNWDGLAYCESTNNPKAVNNPAGFLSTYGLFQFDLPTWQSVGGSGNPGDAGAGGAAPARQVAVSAAGARALAVRLRGQWAAGRLTGSTSRGVQLVERQQSNASTGPDRPVGACAALGTVDRADTAADGPFPARIRGDARRRGADGRWRPGSCEDDRCVRSFSGEPARCRRDPSAGRASSTCARRRSLGQNFVHRWQHGAAHRGCR